MLLDDIFEININIVERKFATYIIHKVYFNKCKSRYKTEMKFEGNGYANRRLLY